MNFSGRRTEVNFYNFRQDPTRPAVIYKNLDHADRPDSARPDTTRLDPTRPDPTSGHLIRIGQGEISRT